MSFAKQEQLLCLSKTNLWKELVCSVKSVSHPVGGRQDCCCSTWPGSAWCELNQLKLFAFHTDVLSLLLLYSAVLALLRGLDTFFSSFMAAELWLLQEIHLPPEILSDIFNSKHMAARLQIYRQIINVSQSTGGSLQRITVVS